MVTIGLMPGKKHRNILIIVASLIILMLSVFYFFWGIQFQEKGNFPTIGEVFKKDNELRRRIDGNLSWVDIEHSAKLYPGDKVFTGDASLAQLNLLDLAEIGMNSSTLLKIDPKALEGLSVQGGLGFFTAKLSGKMSKASFKLQNASLELNSIGSEIHVNGFEEKTMVSAIDGKISFKSLAPSGNSSVQTLAPNQLLGMNRAGTATIMNLPVKLIAPASREELILMPEVPIHFKWQTLIQGIPLSLELSKTPTFESTFFKKDVSGISEVDIPVAAAMGGAIYWRVVQPEHDVYYHAQDFEYEPVIPPVIFDPSFRQNYPSGLPVGPEFAWEKRFDFIYDGEIQQLDGGISGAQKFTGPNTKYLVSKLSDGHYQFRVRASKNKLISGWSPWQPFTVGDVDRNGIELVSPADMATATFIFPKKEIVFEWNGGDAQSQIQIATDEKFTNVVSEAITDQHSFNWHPGNEGKFFWHVKKNPKAKVGATRSLFVVEPKISLLTPKNKIAYLFRDQDYMNIDFTWEDVSLSDQYRIEFSNTNDFKRIIESAQLSKPQFEFKILKRNEVVYWRIKTDHQVSETRQFRIFKAAGLLAPVLGEVTAKIVEDTTIFGGTTNHGQAKLGTDFVEIFLPQIENAATFHLEITRDREFKNLVISKTLNSPIFRWNNPEPGEYYWKVSYKDSAGHLSPQSGIAHLVIEPKDVPKPKVKAIDKPVKKNLDESIPY